MDADARAPWAVLGQEPFATHLKADPDEPVQTFRPRTSSVVVVGGETQPTWRILAGESNRRLLTTISVDDWR